MGATTRQLLPLSPPTSPVPETSTPPPLQQSPSRLLSLPTELRLLICRHMSLTPVPSDLHAWLGSYNTCHQLRSDMRSALNPATCITQHISCLPNCWTSHGHAFTPLTYGPPDPTWHMIRHITLSIPIPTHLRSSCCHALLSHLYTLYLTSLEIHLLGPEGHLSRLLYGDLKSWGEQYFLEYVRRDAVRCQEVRFTLDVLAQKEGGREKRTELRNTIPGTTTEYVLEIVQDKEGRQTERVYESENRFRAARERTWSLGCRYD